MPRVNPPPRCLLNRLRPLRRTLSLHRESLKVAFDPQVSSANPHEYAGLTAGNTFERGTLRNIIADATKKLSSRRSFLYEYALSRYYELKFSSAAADVFAKIRLRVDDAIAKIIPESVKKLTAAYENLDSDNAEDWSNAVHSCRRLLVDLADAIFPAAEDKVVEYDGKKRTIKLGKSQYVNRIIAFVESRSSSARYNEIVGSHLAYLGNRLDSICSASNKGTHAVVGKEEAERYLIYTYLLVGDVLSLIAE
jgi:hypothetical protein